ncbi:MAG: hypothetical protein DRP62_04330 [Planctomycetota bacterium]|nr:MAG: hypothetical protein DRP62_04330 [Planctomycetota bacterium]
MIEVALNHCQIVEKSISGERDVDERTFASVAILGERLERLKKLDKAFANITFSPTVKKLTRREMAYS